MPDSGGYHKNNYWLYFKASWEGALRGGALLIIEHPLESIKTQWQDKIQFKSKKEIVHNIYKEKGLVGFYRGFVPNLIRVMSKQFYRWPMMLFFPRLYSKYLPNRIKKKFPTINKILSGFTIANIEIFLICPLDRMKIYFMTMTGTSALATSHLISNFFIINKNKLIPELFRGLESSFWRSNISWISFLYLDEKFKQIWKKSKLRSGKSQELTYFDLLVISILVGTGNLIASNYASNFSYAI